MAYETLRKLYYGDKDIYKKAYADRINSPVTVKLKFTVSGREAFFTEVPEVTKLAFDILRMDKRVHILRTALPGKAAEQYAFKCLIDEIVLTNKIEGVHSSRREIGEVLSELQSQSKEKGKNSRFEGLVNKYLKLMFGENVPLDTCRDIRALYDEIVLDEVASEAPDHVPDGKIFRKDQTTIRSATDKIVHTGIYPESKIIEAMDAALAFLNDESIERLYRICLFHYLLEYIHPFYDGNGRLGRFILSYCLSNEMDYLLAYRISETIKENQSEYYKTFEICNDIKNMGDLTPFLIMMLKMVYTSISELYNSLERKSISWARYEGMVKDFPKATEKKMNALYSLLIQAALFSEEGISFRELEEMLGVKYATVKAMIDNVPDDMLITERSGRVKCFKINIRLLDEMFLNEGETDTGFES